MYLPQRQHLARSASASVFNIEIHVTYDVALILNNLQEKLFDTHFQTLRRRPGEQIPFILVRECGAARIHRCGAENILVLQVG